MSDKIPHLYKTEVIWTSERKGSLSSPGLTDIQVATPPEFPKGHPNIWSPEHLYVASANICLMTTFLSIAENSKLDFVSFRSEGTGKLDQVDGKFMMTEIELKPTVIIKKEGDRERAQRIVLKAEEHCLISYSMKTKTVVKPVIEVSGSR